MEEEDINFYCDKAPTIGEIVQVVFTERQQGHTDGVFVEYKGKIIMVDSMATKKKKIKSYNQIIPLNKPLAAIVEDFNPDTMMGSVSRAYLDDSDEDYNSKFLSNKKLYEVIRQICIKLEIDFNGLWLKKIFPFIISFSNEDNISYLELFVKHLDEIKGILDNDELFEMIDKKLRISLLSKKDTFKKEIGIISNEGVELTKKIIRDTLDDSKFEEVKDDIMIKYFNTPKFILESSLSNDVLESFIEKLKENANNSGNIFVKSF